MRQLGEVNTAVSQLPICGTASTTIQCLPCPASISNFLVTCRKVSCPCIQGASNQANQHAFEWHGARDAWQDALVQNKPAEIRPLPRQAAQTQCKFEHTHYQQATTRGLSCKICGGSLGGCRQRQTSALTKAERYERSAPCCMKELVTRRSSTDLSGDAEYRTATSSEFVADIGASCKQSGSTHSHW
jgi:hypothetical protein